MPGTFSPPPRVSYPDMHYDTCRDARAVMHAGIANWRFPLKSVAGKTFPTFPVHAQPAILRIWLDAHGAVIGVTLLESINVYTGNGLIYAMANGRNLCLITFFPYSWPAYTCTTTKLSWKAHGMSRYVGDNGYVICWPLLARKLNQR